MIWDQFHKLYIYMRYSTTISPATLPLLLTSQSENDSQERSNACCTIEQPSLASRSHQFSRHTTTVSSCRNSLSLHAEILSLQNPGYFPPAFVMAEGVSRSKARRLNHPSKQKWMEIQLLKEKRLRVAAEAG